MIRKNGRGSLPAREKPVGQGSNPCVPMPIFTFSIETEVVRTSISPD